MLRIVPFSGGEHADVDAMSREASAWLHRFEPRAFQDYADFAEFEIETRPGETGQPCATPYWKDLSEARRVGGRSGIARAPWRTYPLDIAGLPLINETALLLVFAEYRPMMHLALLAGLTYGWLEQITLEFRGDRLLVLWKQARIPKKHLLASGSSLGVAFEFPGIKQILQERFHDKDFPIAVLLPATAEAWKLRLSDQEAYLEQMSMFPHFVLPVRGPSPSVSNT